MVLRWWGITGMDNARCLKRHQRLVERASSVYLPMDSRVAHERFVRNDCAP